VRRAPRRAVTILSPRQQVVGFRAVVIGLVAAAAVTLVPLWAPLVLAAWVAAFTRPLLTRTAKVKGVRHRAAGALVVALVTAIMVPLGIALASLTQGATDLVRRLLASDGAKSALVAIVSADGSGDAEHPLAPVASPGKILALLQEHGAQAWDLGSGIASTAAAAVLSLFVFVYAVYVFLVDGPEHTEWIEEHAPLDVEHTRRLAAAFHETGRGLFVSLGLTGLAQGALATITYVALGVPRALVLGLLTCFASLIPSVGSGLVWVPITVGLALAGKTASAVIMACVGVFFIGTVDNVLRPVFARYGKLELSTFILLMAIFGGLAVFGPWGLVLGPLFVRLAKEALTMARLDRARADEPPAPAPATDATRPPPPPKAPGRRFLRAARAARRSRSARA
jgi:predicted PurR-regulated permease PerM